MARGLAYRRETSLRKREKVRKFIKAVWFRNCPIEERDQLVATLEKKVATTPHRCSKSCCSNPRRWAKGNGRFTVQELRQLCA